MPRYRRGSGTVYRRGKHLWLSYYRDGRRIREPVRTKDPAEARRLLNQKLGRIAEGTFTGPEADRVTFEQLAQGLLEDYQLNGRRSLKWVRIKVDKHLLPFFTGKRAHLITTSDIRAFVTRRQKQGASNAEINREIAALKRAFNLGLQGGTISRKPQFIRLSENNVRRGFFERREFEALLANLPDYLRASVTFAYLTGWRLQSEILTLTWDRVNLEEGSIRLPKGSTKNREGRVIFLEGELGGLMNRQWSEHRTLFPDCQFVFHRRGTPIRDLRTAWANACRSAELSGKIPHDFRRTAVRNMVRSHIPERVAMEISGHRTRDVFERYNIVSENDLRDAARKLGQRLSTETVTSLDTNVMEGGARSRKSLN
jgi:integrase